MSKNGFVVGCSYQIEEGKYEDTDKVSMNSLKGGDFVYLSSKPDELSDEANEYLADSFAEGAELGDWCKVDSRSKTFRGYWKHSVKGGTKERADLSPASR